MVWRSDGQQRYVDFTIVHKAIRSDRHPSNCDPGNSAGYLYSLDVADLLGPDGLAQLLSWLSVGPFQG